jgi:2-isopropylmalate synthase
MSNSHAPDTGSERVLVFDTTLRDGEQSPGASMNIAEKLKVAQALADLNVDIIEAGFPIASPGDFEAVRAVAGQIEGPIIAGLARCNRGDIDRAWEAVQPATRPRIHVFLATSAIHREHKLKMAKEEIVRRTREGVAQAREYCEDVEFSPEDASRTEPDFLTEVVQAAIEAGATTVNIPDTVGYAVPSHMKALIEHLVTHVSNIDEAIISVHCHNDLGLGVANTLAALKAGARQVECTINGIGERAGNASLEEIVMAIRTRSDHYGLHTGIKTEGLYPASRLLSNITGLQVQRNKAIVGENAFAHEAGIHQHGMLQHSSTYEIMRPQDVGVGKTNLVLGKHSGKHAFRDRVDALGFTLDDVKLQSVFDDFKRLADRKPDIYDADIEALVQGHMEEVPEHWKIVGFQTVAGTDVQHSASVKMQGPSGDVYEEAACGDGPVDSVFKAIQRTTRIPARLQDYQVRSVTVGKDAQGEVNVEAEYDGRVYRGRAVSTDVIRASAEAYVGLINRIVTEVGVEHVAPEAAVVAVAGAPRS